MTSDLAAAENLAQAIRLVAQKAHSEEDVRMGVEQALGATLTALKITATPEYEKTLLSGSADAVYGHVVIEYEKPGKIAKETGRAETVGQLMRYLLGETSQHGEKQAEALSSTRK